jgi:maltose O-acetyltransferase
MTVGGGWYKAARARVRTLYYRLRARAVLRGCELAGDVYAQGQVEVSGPGRIRIGREVLFYRGIAPQRLASAAGAEIEIGDNTRFNYGASIAASRAVRIGANCMIASFVTLDDSAAEFGAAAPIVIEDNVWIAHGATVAPGVRIGHRSVVAAGSVVLRDVPADTLAIGNPARCVALDLLAGQKA